MTDDDELDPDEVVTPALTQELDTNQPTTDQRKPRRQRNG